MGLKIKAKDINNEYGVPIITIKPASKCTVSGPLKSIYMHSETRATVRIHGLPGDFKISGDQIVDLSYPDQPWREHNMTEPQWRNRKVKLAVDDTPKPLGFYY